MATTRDIASRKRLATVVAAALFAGFAFGPAASAFGEAAGPASCMGHEASGVSPPGSSDEAPGGMRELSAFIRSLPGPPGATFKGIAQLHEGSHAKCDEELEGGGE